MHDPERLDEPKGTKKCGPDVPWDRFARGCRSLEKRKRNWASNWESTISQACQDRVRIANSGSDIGWRGTGSDPPLWLGFTKNPQRPGCDIRSIPPKGRFRFRRIFSSSTVARTFELHQLSNSIKFQQDLIFVAALGDENKVR